MRNVASKSALIRLDAHCERIIAQFEQADSPEPIAFTHAALTKIDAALQPALVTELARIELEHNFARDYLDEMSWKPSVLYTNFAQLFVSEELRGSLAFEHYRLGRLYGRNISVDEVGKLYEIGKPSWKELPLGNPLALAQRQTSEFPRVGQTFCDYPLIAELGRGALARVYLARQTDLASRLVVLKISSRLSAEADKLAKLQHTNIVPVYSVHRSEAAYPLYAICMPYLGSLTLADLLKLFERKVGLSENIDALISTLVARRRSTLIDTTKDSITHEADASQTRLVSKLESTVESAAQKNTASDGKVSSSRLERQLGYDELMGALHQMIQRPNDFNSACQLIEGITSGIAFAHSIGIVHRDLKPENVLIANDGRPVVLDFNLSDEPGSDQAEIVGGTLPYMSKQQLQSLHSKRPALPADDVFAIGTIFYRLLTGKLPYESRTLDHLSQLIEERKVEVTPVRELAPHVPRSLAAIVMKCLATSESIRYVSAVELLEDLVCFREHRKLLHAADRSPVEAAQRFIKRNPVVTSTTSITTVSALLLIAIGAGWWWTIQRAQQLDQQLHLRQLVAAMPGLVAQLHGPSRDLSQLQRAIPQATELLTQWHVKAESQAVDTQLCWLTAEERRQASERLGQLAFLLASAEANLAELEASKAGDHRQAALAWSKQAASLAPQLEPACRFQLYRIEHSEKSAPFEEVASDSSLANTSLAQLMLARQRGDLKSWLLWSDVMTKEQPDDATAWFNLGSASFTTGNFQRAQDCFDVAAKLQAGSPTSIFWRGVASYQLNDYPRAIDDFTQCLESDANWVAARHNRALAAFAIQRLDDARADAEYLIEHEQAGPRVWLLSAQIKALQGKADDAKQDRQAALAAICYSADDWVAVGVQQIASKPQDALSAFRKAQQIEPANVAAWLNAAHVLSEQLAQNEAAIEAMKRLITLRPKEATHYATRGILASRTGRESMAIEDAVRASQLQPKPIEMLQISGIYALLSQANTGEAKSQQLSQSLEWMRRALSADPKLVSLAEQDPDTQVIHGQPECRELFANAKALIKR